MPQEIVRKPLTSDFGQQHGRLHSFDDDTGHFFACGKRIFEQATAGCISPLRAFGDVRPILLRATMTFAYSFDRSVIDSTEPLAETP